ncbi:MAG: hypothetical protein U0670_11295 [Anaerolineae bacterium]
MYQKNHREDETELNVEGDVPVISAGGDDDADGGEEATASNRAASPSNRAARAAAERAKKRPQKRTTRPAANKNPYRTRSAAAIRAEREARQKPRSVTQAADPENARRSSYSRVDHHTVMSILRHPTRVVTEADLREEYGYVLNDLRVTGLLAGGLIIVLIILAQVLPK